MNEEICKVLKETCLRLYKQNEDIVTDLEYNCHFRFKITTDGVDISSPTIEVCLEDRGD